MALTSDEQDILDTIRGSLPHWFTDRARAQEDLYIAAKSAGIALAQIKDWFDDALILEAPGATLTEPDWLNQHARDRGTSRQNNETDATLAYRLRNTDEAVNPASVLAAVNAILAANGWVTSPGAHLLELPRDGAFMGVGTGGVAYDQVVGGVFTGPAATVMTFTPTTPFLYPPWSKTAEPNDTVSSTPPGLLWSSVPALQDPWAGGATLPVKPGRARTYEVVITGAADAGNDGTFPVVGLAGGGVRFTNAAGVAAVDASVLLKTQTKTFEGVVMQGSALCYMNDDAGGAHLADRIGRPGGCIVIILPYIADSSARDSVRKSLAEMLRQKKAAGVVSIVEARANP